MAKSGKILLVDDEPDLIELIGYNLRQAGYVVVTAGDGEEALRMIEAERPDLVILDLMMPNLDGFETCRRIRMHATMGDMPILMLTARGEDSYQVKGLDMGADDYIQKPVSTQVLQSRVRALLRRAKPAADEAQPPVLQIHDLKIDRERYVVFKGESDDAERLHLPKKEFELLYLLALDAGKTRSRQELLDEIWGTDVYVTPRTVDVHIRKIRDKIGEGYIETVTGVGYRFRE